MILNIRKQKEAQMRRPGSQCGWRPRPNHVNPRTSSSTSTTTSELSQNNILRTLNIISLPFCGEGKLTRLLATVSLRHLGEGEPPPLFLAQHRRYNHFSSLPLISRSSRSRHPRSAGIIISLSLPTGRKRRRGCMCGEEG